MFNSPFVTCFKNIMFENFANVLSVLGIMGFDERQVSNLVDRNYVDTKNRKHDTFCSDV